MLARACRPPGPATTFGGIAHPSIHDCMTARSLAAALLLLAALPLAAGAQAPAQSGALDRANMDTTCAACTDFYQYANGGWLKHATIPASYSSFGSFQELYDKNEAVLHDILEADAERVRSGADQPGTPQWKVVEFYATCMDRTSIDRRGIAALAHDLALVSAIQSSADLAAALPTLERRAGIAPWSDGATIDARDAANTIAGLYQGGLTLPNSDYYTKTDSASVAIRGAFTDHVARMFVLLGDTPAQAASEAATVLAFESRLAHASRSPIQLRDVVANYHRFTLQQLDSIAPHVGWARFYRTIGVTEPARIDVGQPEFFATVDTMMSDGKGGVPIAQWKTYLRWHLLHASAYALSSPIVREDFRFNQLFSGAPEMLPRWKRCVAATDNALGEQLGQDYVARTFTPEAKARAVAIVDNLVRELRARIEQLPWMGADTKAQALVKLDAFTRKIGYPDTWRDYSAMRITGDDYLANVRAVHEFAANRDWAKIGRPTNRTEWGMTPPTVNAYENPLLNEIVFPAGILQPPFYDPKADDAVNYGAMGAVIGHEMSHAFDDQGRKYDTAGNLRDWWTTDDARRYDTEEAPARARASAAATVASVAPTR